MVVTGLVSAEGDRVRDFFNMFSKVEKQSLSPYPCDKSFLLPPRNQRDLSTQLLWSRQLRRDQLKNAINILRVAYVWGGGL